MIPSFLLALREGVEIALVIGILLGSLRKLQRQELTPSIWWGVLAALGVSGIVAAALTAAGASLAGPGEVIFEGLAMLAAAGLLTWMIFWMQRQSRFLRGKIEQEVRAALDRTGRRALFGVAFLAVVREGVELALFLVAAGLASNPAQELTGSLIGLAAAAGLGWLLFSSTRRLPLANFFLVTNVLLVVFAAGLVAHGVGELNEIGWIPAIVEPIYNLSPVLSQNSAAGQVLGMLAGYTAAPSLAQSLAYLAYFALLLPVVFRFQRQLLLGAAQNS